MKNRYYVASGFIAVSALLFPCCKKETTIKEEYNPNITLYGTWLVVENYNSGNQVKYLNFKTDKTCDIYQSDNQTGMTSGFSVNYSPSSDQVIIDIDGSGSPFLYNYIVRNNSLFLKSGGQTYFKAQRTSESSVALWYTNITAVDQISGSGLIFMNQQGIGFDGTNILICHPTNNTIDKLSLTTRAMNGSVNIDTYPNTVESDGTDYWIANSSITEIKRYTAAGGSPAGTSAAMAQWISGIGFDDAGANLWCYSNSEDSIYCYNKTSGMVTDKYYLGSGCGDLAWSNGKLYITKDNYVHRISVSPFRVDKTYRFSENETIYGIASTGGTDFWLNMGSRLVKVSLN